MKASPVEKYGSYEKYLEAIGRPFYVTLAWTNNDTTNTFTLQSTDFDWNGDGTDDTAPFDGYVWIITGINIDTLGSSGTFILRVVIDGTNMIFYRSVSSSSASLIVDGSSDGAGAQYPTVKDAYGKNLICRTTFSIKKSATPGNAGTAYITGYAVPERLI